MLIMKNPLDYLWYKIYKLSFYTEGKYRVVNGQIVPY